MQDNINWDIKLPLHRANLAIPRDEVLELLYANLGYEYIHLMAAVEKIFDREKADLLKYTTSE